jgi:hypothetical protein
MRNRLPIAIAVLAARTPTLSRHMLEAALYLVDLEIFHRTGKTLSGSTWRRLGPWPEVDGFAEALDELSDAGQVVWAPEGISWTGSARRAPAPHVSDGLNLVVELVARSDRAGLMAIVGNISPFRASEEDPYGATLRFDRRPATLPQPARTSGAVRAAFKRDELVRVSDLLARGLDAADDS